MSRLFGSLALYLLCLNLALAEVVVLHQDPKAGSPNIGSIDLSKGVVPIYSPKNSEWVKVADPNNGNVGWIKQSDFKNANSAFIQINQETKDAKGNTESSGYNLHIGKPLDMNDPKVKAKINEMNQLQENVQRNMKIQIQDMVKSINDLYQKQMKLLEDSGYYTPDAKPAASTTPTPGQ